MIVDAAERARALDPACSFIVDAPAGSGKTELLTQRFLRLLAAVNEPESILAITFTRKSAAEMRGRILTALRAAGSDVRPQEDHAAVTWDLAHAALARDRAAGWELLDNPARLRIQTIDSLCASITRRMPWLSRFGSQPEIAARAGDLYRDAARNLLSRAPQEVRILMEHLDNNMKAVEDLLAGILQRREQWLPHVARASRRESLEKVLRAVIGDTLETVAERVPFTLAEELIALARFAGGQVPDETRPLAACAGLRDLPGRQPEDKDLWDGIADLLLTRGGAWRTRLTRSLGFPPECAIEKNRCACLLEALRGGHDAFRDALLELRRLPPPAFNDRQWRVLDALLRLLLEAEAELLVVFGERGEVDFAEVARRARQALGDAEDPTDLALALDWRIQHVLVDEFQDTSVSQYSLLEQLTAGWEPGDGRTLFLVGDPMQSIYGFREAEVGLFLRARREGIQQVRLEPLRLRVNFRSRQGIVEWVNRAFESVFPKDEDIAAGAIPYTPSDWHHPSAEPAVEVHPVLGKDDEREAAIVVDLVRQARQRAPGERVAVLVRARTHLPYLVKALRTAGLRFRALEIDPLSDRQPVRDLLALTTAMLHPADRAAWLAVLRGPWCGLTLADLAALAAEDPRGILWDAMRDEARRGRLSEDGRRRLERLCAIFATSFRESRRMPLRRWVEAAWLALGGPAALRAASDRADVETFFDLLDGLDHAGEIRDLPSLAAEVESLFAAPDLEADDSLQILTIHKAKGLEFETVILPGLGRAPRSDSPRLLYWLEQTGRDGRPRLLLAPIKAAEEQEDPMGAYVRHAERKKRDYETARLLYVAATRAIRNLHLIGHTNVRERNGALELAEPAGDSLLKRLWPVLAPEFTALLEAQPPDSAVAAGVPERRPLPLRRIPADWVPPEPPDPVRWRRPLEDEAETAADADGEHTGGETLRHVGTVVHRMLRRIGEEGPERWDRPAVEAHAHVFRAALESLGVPQHETGPAAGKVIEAVSRAIADPRGAWILRQRPDARCEYAVTGMAGSRFVRGVIDRTFTGEDGARWIIDYKNSYHAGPGLEKFLDEEESRYREQLESYASLFSRLADRPVRLGLYFPLLGAWREWAAKAAQVGV